MLKIRLQRVGRKHDPSHRIILTDAKQGPKSGKFIENLGFYDARRDIKQTKGDRIKYWIENGAQISETVHNILIDEKVIEGKKINVLPKKTPIKKEVKEEKKATLSATKQEDEKDTPTEGEEQKEIKEVAEEPKIGEEEKREEKEVKGEEKEEGEIKEELETGKETKIDK